MYAQTQHNTYTRQQKYQMEQLDYNYYDKDHQHYN